MAYIRTKDRLAISDKATHELIEDICCAGYLRTLKKGACVTIGKVWFNYYGNWVDIIDEDGCHYSITPNEVERVTKEVSKADTIEELCDAYVIIPKGVKCNPFTRNINEDISHFINDSHIIYAAIWVSGEHGEPILKSVAIMNEKGELELL